MSEHGRAPGTSQSLERGLAILSSFSVGTPADRRQRGRARARPHAEHDAPVRRNARAPRLPPPGSRERGSTPSARASSTSASRRSTRWSFGTSQRRTSSGSATRPGTPSTWRSSTTWTSSTSSASARRAAARPRSTSTSTSALGCPRTAPRWARCCSRSSPTPSEMTFSDRITYAQARAEHAHLEGGVARRAPARPRHRHRREQRGARLWASLGRGAGDRRERRSGRRGEPRRPPDDGVARRPRRTDRAADAANRRRDLRPARLPRPPGASVT